MTVRAHPSHALRQAYALGQVSPGVALALESHFGLCSVCALAAESLGRGRRGRPAGRQGRDAAASPSTRQTAEELTRWLEDRRAGRWRRLSRKIRIAELGGMSGLGEGMHLVRAAPGASLAPLAAADVEMVLALQGSASADEKAYGPGDLLDAPQAALGRAVADPVAGFVGLVVSVDTWPRWRLPRLMAAALRLTMRREAPPNR